MAIDIKKLNEQDLDRFIALIKVFEEVFEMENFIIPDNTHLQTVLTKADFIVFVATDEDRIIGGLTAYVLHQYYSLKPLAYIYDLAVQKSLQRQGIGRKLISAFTTYCKENDFEEVFVQADKADAHAIDFYRSTAIANEEDVIHFYYTLKK